MAELLARPDAAMNFSQIKDAALNLLDQVSNSLISTDKLKDLVALVKYNTFTF